jgi:hypothetical protein
MELTLGERLNLVGLLPKESDYVTLKRISELRDRLIPSEKEAKEFELKLERNAENPQIAQWIWNAKGSESKAEIEIGEVCEIEIVNILKKRNDEKKITPQDVSLYEKFIEKI